MKSIAVATDMNGGVMKLSNGAEGDRTLYLRVANPALSQMSYGPDLPSS
jgi:hypothetical protein